ncbi:MAG TPA: GNAT family N-acetyltransferase [Geodermatophilus sp.]|nr:GNAT family N-acetyltransferase [Geodermatophilus sp.]
MTGARVAGPADRAEIADLRTRVFVQEQGVPPEIERDALDAAAVHVLARDDAGRVVATGRLVVRDGRAVIGRMAVDAAARGRGHGAAVLDELHGQAVLRGLPEAELHAQVSARGFYERAGYAAVGGVYEEAGIAHVTMRRRLPVLRPAAAAETAGLLGSAVPADRWWVLVDGTPLAAVAALRGALTGLGVAAGGEEWGRRLACAVVDGVLPATPPRPA